MKRFLSIFLLTTLIAAATSYKSRAQEVGLSFSYFIPKNGYFSTPISPFSLRGVGVDLNRYMAIQTGFSLYRMSGMNVKDIENIETNDAIVGPNFTIMVPLELVLQLVGQSTEFRIKGGGFAFYGFANKINNGNLDKAIRKYESWDVADSDVDGKHGIGLGFFFGTEFVFYVSNQWGVSLEANYFIGDAPFEMTGSYIGGTMSGPLETRPIDWKDAKIDYTGLEISIGILFGT
ncbi:hypothetical protein [Fulvivirga sedimenti]|uniref:Outer membrane protein beta-barrel domain-containing protein n=1 Tax=Fulvivirga sedimenti TaxID=2879465 RepID=A0A9X1L1Z7_9BACT|nr:hypothetical protein [Fulvivirga sedimenti]MCA6075291.1 hypothetical protein [Fulvivirga sedimenti]MCA6076468.1 hypothetical protein [Fulvivirga sedimenti]MCA6077596.1 hypothetical protein [Fulvivirga sedimenti]